jgi:preprotein translocase subunit SecD
MRKSLRMLIVCSAVTSFSPALAAPHTFTIGGVSFSESEIIDARAQPYPSGMAAVMITMSPEGAQKLAALSRANSGKAIKIELDGKALSEPVVQGEISDGVAQISGNFTVPEADALALAISGKPPLKDTLEEP